MLLYFFNVSNGRVGGHRTYSVSLERYNDMIVLLDSSDMNGVRARGCCIF